MTDEELLIWLRVEDTNLTDFAADRIEALLNLNEALVELMDDRETKLAKAVVALEFVDGDFEVVLKARATLAEIKLQSSEFATQKGEIP